MFFSGIKSSSEISPKLLISISVLLSSLYLSLITVNSSMINWINFAWFARISSKFLIISFNSFSSSFIFSIARPVNLPNLISVIAFACLSDKLNTSIIVAWASASVLEFLIILIISSILLTAIFNPSKIWALALAFSKSNWTLLVTTSIWWFK